MRRRHCADDPSSARHDRRYDTLPARELPTTEALSDVRRRVVPYWQDVIAADLHDGRVVLVVAHSNSLRALCMHLDTLTRSEVETLNIPTGVPLQYELDHEYRPHVRGGTYLDPISAAAGVAEVLAQGGPLARAAPDIRTPLRLRTTSHSPTMTRCRRSATASASPTRHRLRPSPCTSAVREVLHRYDVSP